MADLPKLTLLIPFLEVSFEASAMDDPARPRPRMGTER